MNRKGLYEEEVKAADELLNDATKKLEEALSASSVNKTSVSAAKMILDTARGETWASNVQT